MRREDAVVHDEVDVRARDEHGELFEELQGLEDQVAGPSAHGVLSAKRRGLKELRQLLRLLPGPEALGEMDGRDPLQQEGRLPVAAPADFPPREATGRAAHLIDEVLPRVPMRQ
jgi:hypothetical protein